VAHGWAVPAELRTVRLAGSSPSRDAANRQFEPSRTVAQQSPAVPGAGDLRGFHGWHRSSPRCAPLRASWWGIHGSGPSRRRRAARIHRRRPRADAPLRCYWRWRPTRLDAHTRAGRRNRWIGASDQT
jgi:hypothetical protein